MLIRSLDNNPDTGVFFRGFVDYLWHKEIRNTMNEKDFKELYKLCIDCGYKRVPPVLKECLKKVIDEANTIEELLLAVAVAVRANNS